MPPNCTGESPRSKLKQSRPPIDARVRYLQERKPMRKTIEENPLYQSSKKASVCHLEQI